MKTDILYYIKSREKAGHGKYQTIESRYIWDRLNLKDDTFPGKALCSLMFERCSVCFYGGREDADSAILR